YLQGQRDLPANANPVNRPSNRLSKLSYIALLSKRLNIRILEKQKQ
ncbi:hypothetical protein CP8484711_0336, partial [Chlamydia psittaci 84-8471/1]